MQLNRKAYTISAETLQTVLAALGNNRMVQLPDGDSDNNEDIIEAERRLVQEISLRDKE